ncbi:hypothetical protein DTO217A2_2385 [Paecilomyces variotii]|nr:hypothetical protein DTO217A2_2385 [Paecilomyces variotii]
MGAAASYEMTVTQVGLAAFTRKYYLLRRPICQLQLTTTYMSSIRFIRSQIPIRLRTTNRTADLNFLPEPSMASLRTSYRLLPSIRVRPARFQLLSSRFYSSGPDEKVTDIESIISTPSWSVRSLLPDDSSKSQTPALTPKELRHLLRLSALPQPSSEAEEKKMLETLESQIHFVKEIQRVDTTGVEPLRSIRDETPEATKENTIGLDALKDTMARERVVGRSRKIERAPAEKNTRPDGDTWDNNALGCASKTMGRYFVVETSR